MATQPLVSNELQSCHPGTALMTYEEINAMIEELSDLSTLPASGEHGHGHVLPPSEIVIGQRTITMAFGNESNEQVQPAPICVEGSAQDQKRSKAIPWTEAEHKMFLLGVEIYGGNKWTKISRDFVPTKTPLQLASHAQKYYKRKKQLEESQKLQSVNENKKRKSINDIDLLEEEKIELKARLGLPPPSSPTLMIPQVFGVGPVLNDSADGDWFGRWCQNPIYSGHF